MSEMIVVTFDDPFEADRVLTELTHLEDEYLIELEDAIVAVRAPDGKVRFKQTHALTTLGAASGGLAGAMWGTVIGLLFLNPLLGFVAGSVIGAGTGALTGSLLDYGIDDEFVKSLGDKLKPNSSAIFLLIRKVEPDKVLKHLERFKGHVLRSSLSAEQEQKFELALNKDAVVPPVAQV